MSAAWSRWLRACETPRQGSQRSTERRIFASCQVYYDTTVTRQIELDRITAMPSICYAGAGSGNRTRIFSLEGCCSTTELYPHSLKRCALCQVAKDASACSILRMIPCKKPARVLLARTVARGRGMLQDRQWWRGLDSNQRRLSQRIYSPSPLTTRAPLRTAAESCNEAFRGFSREGPPEIREAPYGERSILSTAARRPC